MYIARSFLLLMTGAVSAVAFVLSCGDNLSPKATADAAVDAPKAPDAASICDCPPSERPLAGRFSTISNTKQIALGGFDVVSASCPAGSQRLSGSCTQDLLNRYQHLTLEQSGSSAATPLEWFCWFRNNDPSLTGVTVRATVTCLTL
jgi:hypothetical protein